MAPPTNLTALEEVRCERCGNIARRQLMGTYVCDTCQCGVMPVFPAPATRTSKNDLSYLLTELDEYVARHYKEQPHCACNLSSVVARLRAQVVTLERSLAHETEARLYSEKDVAAITAAALAARRAKEIAYEQVAEVHSGCLRWTLPAGDLGYERGNYPLYRRAQKSESKPSASTDESTPLHPSPSSVECPKCEDKS